MVEIWENQIQLLAKGDKQAYATVFREFYRPLVMYACRFVVDRDAAEDIVQSFFCRLWENCSQLVNIKSLRSYFYSSVRNRSLNYLRDKHVVGLEEAEVRKEEDFLMEMMEEEVYRELYAAIYRLPDKCQQIVLMKLIGKDNREIAAELLLSEETIRSQLRRGRELLHKQLSGILAVLVLIQLN